MGVQVLSYSSARFLPVLESKEAADDRDVIEAFLDSMFENANDAPLDGGSETSLSVSITVQ